MDRRLIALLAGDKSDETQVREIVLSFVSSLAETDGAAACADMTDALQEEFVTAVVSATGDAFKDKDCGEIMSTSLEQGGEAAEQALEAAKDLKVTSVDVTGDTAKVKAEIPVQGETVQTPYEAEKVDGEWRISCCIGPGPQG